MAADLEEEKEEEEMLGSYATEETSTEEEPKPSFKAKHKGSGRWVVLNEITGEKVNEGYLKKNEANALAEKLNEGEEEPEEEKPKEEKPTLIMRDGDD